MHSNSFSIQNNEIFLEDMAIKVKERCKVLSTHQAKTVEGTAFKTKNAVRFQAAGPKSPQGMTLKNQKNGDILNYVPYFAQGLERCTLMLIQEQKMDSNVDCKAVSSPAIKYFLYLLYLAEKEIKFIEDDGKVPILLNVQSCSPRPMPID